MAMGTIEEENMSSRTGMLAGLTASPLVWRGVVLAGALVVAQPAATFGAGVDTYRWLGELVALDEGARTLTVTSRVATPGGLDVEGLKPGDRILITWSGSEHGAQSIAAVAPDDGRGLAPGDRFRLRARFVAADATRQSLTFSVSGPSSELAPLRAAMQGTWATVTSPHRPAHGPAAVTAVDAYGTGKGHGPAAGDTYAWNAELVSLDNAGRSLTVRSRLVSPGAAADGLAPGDAIRITWSGYRDRAVGVRAVDPADDSGLWGSDRFLLDAELVAMDSRYVTFTVEPPASDIDAVRALRPGTWATATSPHQPSAKAKTVAAIAAYAASPVDAPRTADAAYRWHGELVSLDDAGETLTVKSRLVSNAAAASAADLAKGDPIVITWSGFEDRTDGIRAVERDSGLWGDGGFLLQATFVETDPARRYLTFSVEPPADRVSELRAMTRGSWATLSSHHRPAAGKTPVLTVDAYAPSMAPRLAGRGPAEGDTYQWRGELVSRDDASGALTVRSRIVSPSGKVADDVAAGDPIVITWSGFDDQADGIRAVKRDDGSGLWGGNRFLLQAKFAASEGQYVTFTVEPPADSAPLTQGLTPGAWAIGTSPHRPDFAAEAVTLVDAYDPARRARRYAWNGELVSFDKANASITVSAPVEKHVFRYVERFGQGDQVVLIWTPTDDGSRAIRYLELREQSVLEHGYVLPVQFEASDEDSRRITFSTPIPARALRALSGAEAGDWITATSLFDQSYEHAAIIAMTVEGDYAEE